MSVTPATPSTLDADLAAAARELDPRGTYVGRVNLPPDACPRGVGGPTPVAIRPEGVYDLSGHAPTVAQFLALPDAFERARTPSLPRIGSVEDALAASDRRRASESTLHLLAPIDLQVVKACGVTFVTSLVERVIEERAAGDPARADETRAWFQEHVASRLQGLRAGSDEAVALLDDLRGRGIASPYLEVGLGRYGEVFTKAPVLSSVGTGGEVGIRSDSAWNNPEPEVVLVVDPAGRIVGATLGNDVNLRDFEGWSPLLLGVAKDNNGSCAVGPWIRLFDAGFTLERLIETDVTLEIAGPDGFRTQGANRLSEISREPVDLVAQASGTHHQYPDGFVLFLGTMMVPTDDRSGDGRGFTHRPGDRVTIANPLLGTLTNWVTTTDRMESWSSGIASLMDNLARRGLLGHPEADPVPAKR